MKSNDTYNLFKIKKTKNRPNNKSIFFGNFEAQQAFNFKYFDEVNDFSIIEKPNLKVNSKEINSTLADSVNLSTNKKNKKSLSMQFNVNDDNSSLWALNLLERQINNAYSNKDIKRK